MLIGGMFTLEKTGPQLREKPENMIFAMSGRCALYAALLDINLDNRNPRVAYVPAYTCETVLAAYSKAGYSFRFYDVDPEGLKPLFKKEDLDGVSVLALCGYYGFTTYDEDFVKYAKSRGIVVLHDTTHTPYRFCPSADYCAGSLRKWMGIPSGGVALRAAGPFRIQLKEAEKTHIDGRFKAMEERAEALATGDSSFNDKASETFWETEMRLRKMFGEYASDPVSRQIALSFDFDGAAEKRRSNFSTIISSLNNPVGWKPVFSSLPRKDDVPSHFTLYADNREAFSRYLKSNGVASTVYWPQVPDLKDLSAFPGTAWILEHICSIQLDQRYGEKEMKALAAILNNTRGLI